MSSLQTGAPHFKSLMKQYRHANYTLQKALNEFVDNVTKRATRIYISTQIDDNNRLQEVRVSDNIEFGFDNLDERGTNNPFNMGHMKVAHEDDSETSEFGVGMKAGALSASNQLNVYTRVIRQDGTLKYVEIICDFIRMENKVDVNDSYNPFIREISYEEYRMHHPFEQGSTIKLSKIRDCIFHRATQQEITEFICAEISSTYSRYISRGVHIEVNEVEVRPSYDFFADLKCAPFTLKKEMFVLEKEGLPLPYFIRQTKDGRVTWHSYCRKDNKWNSLGGDGLEYIAELLRSGYMHRYHPFNSDGACLQLETTLALYSDVFHRQDCVKDLPMPEDALLIYKDDRCYGKKSLFNHNNGAHNYTVHTLNFLSKSLGKDIGITFNKEISMNGTNELIQAIKSALVESKVGISSDTSTKINAKLCKKAIDNKIIDPTTCPLAKLARVFRPPESTSGSDVDSVPRSRSKPTKSKKQAQSSASTEFRFRFGFGFTTAFFRKSYSSFIG